MSGDGKVDVARDARGVVTVMIDRAHKLNALNSATMTAFTAAIEALQGDESVRAVIVAGAGGKAFVGGADIDEMSGLDETSARAFITRVHRCCAAVRALDAPVIARIDGYCLGAGLELAAACDLRAAAAHAVLGMPEVKLGVPSVVEAALLPRLVGWGRAREMLLLGHTFTAEEAKDWGLLEQVVPASELGAAVERWVALLLEAEPKAVRLQKALIRRWEALPLADAIAAGVDSFAAAWDGETPREAMAAFRAARAAAKKG